jgi:hypothetical protein
MIITNPFAIDEFEKITGRRIHYSPAASSFIDPKMKNHGRALQPARGLMWFCLLKTPSSDKPQPWAGSAK